MIEDIEKVKKNDVMIKSWLIVLLTSLVLAWGIIIVRSIQNAGNTQGQNHRFYHRATELSMTK